jgi:hypothetical protein
MLEALPVSELRLRIQSDNRVVMDIRVDDRWRRIIETYHAGLTDQWLSRGAMETGHFGVKDVTEEYQTQEGDTEW